MTDLVCPNGPFEIDVKVHVTDGSANTGVVTVGMAKGCIPTGEEIANAMAQAAEAAKGQGLRLMNRHEFVTELMGVGRIAVPGPKDFPEPLTAGNAPAARQPEVK